MTAPLTEHTAADYVRSLSFAPEFFADPSSVTASAITEGNINLLFRVGDGERSLLVKQALPYSWRYPEFKLPVERADLENEMLEIEARYCPEQTLRVYFYDQPNHIQVVEDLNRHLVMREGMMKRIRYPLVARHIGEFVARTLFYTSDLFLPSNKKKAMQPRFMNPVMRKLQEDLVFTLPYAPHPNNRWTRLNDAWVGAIYADDALRAEMCLLKERYMTHGQALIHNDLHSGSIMLNERETKVIDPEFAFFGPMGHDMGSYLANLVLNYAAQAHHSPTEAGRKDYRAWILDSMRETWTVFETEFLVCWERDGLRDEWPSPAFKRRYLHQLLQDTAGFGAAEIYRRTIGLAHVADIDSIPDDPTRAAAEHAACEVAYRWLMKRPTFAVIDDLIEQVGSG
jgi:5-methylthioribose kinase